MNIGGMVLGYILHIRTATNEVVKILIWFTVGGCRWPLGLPFRSLSPDPVQGLIWQFVMPDPEWRLPPPSPRIRRVST